MLKLYNSISKKIEEFSPVNQENIKMYVCGPTVYDRIHIGNARSVVIFDTLFRFLKEIYENVTYVRNITDIDDKIIKRAKELGIDELELSQKMANFFHSDCKFLNCLQSTFEPKVSTHIQEIINMIEKLIENGFAYEMNGNVFFSVQKYSDYGSLSRRNLENDIENEDNSIEKRNSKDFALWKNTNEGLKWNSPWGFGRPGWHIECSAMSTKYLGETFDIHGGGADLIFPHHENEIAQSKCCFQKSEYAKLWVHNGTLTVNGVKMSKSLGNFITVQECIDKNFHPAAVRLALLSSNYGNSLNFEEKLIKDMEILISKIEENLQNQEIQIEKSNEVLKILSDNLDTVNLIKNIIKWNKEKDNQKLLYALKVIGIIELLNLKKQQESIPEEIKILAEKRFNLKKEKNFQESDKIRNELRNLGFEIEDLKDSYKILKIK